MNLRIFTVVLCITTVHLTYAQVDTSRVNKELKPLGLQKAVKVPIVLGGAGLLAVTDMNFIGREEIYEERNENFSSFRSHTDDYLQYAPIVGVLTLNALGVKGEHNFSTQMWLLAKSELLMMAIVFPLKKITAVPRPDTGTPNSFPSGHTAQAFVAATFMHKEYGKQNPLYSVLAYGTATSVGVLRMMNNRHWSTDVLVGAGIGILSTNLIYLFHDNRRDKRSKIIAVPTYQNKTIGVNAIISLN